VKEIEISDLEMKLENGISEMEISFRERRILFS